MPLVPIGLGVGDESKSKIIDRQGNRSSLASFAVRGVLRPDQISGLAVWLETGDFTDIYCHEAATPTNPCEDNEVCLCWQDRSTNAFHLTEATNGPTFQAPATTDATTPGRAGYLAFDATNDVLAGASAADWKFLHDGTGMEMFIVCQTVNETNCPIVDTTNKLAGVGAVFYNDDSSTSEGRISFAVRNGGGVLFNIQATSTANVFPVATWGIVHGNHVTAEGAELWLNGTFVGSATAASPSSNNPATALKLGTDFSAGFVANKYAAIIAYNRKLTAAERRAVCIYLGQKYNIAIGNVACIGDSITAGYSALTTYYPARLAYLLGSAWSVQNFGVSGSVVNDAAGTDVYNDQWLHTTTGVKRQGFNYVVSMAGVNDIRNTTDSAATIFSRYQTMLDDIVAEKGMRLVLCAVIPFANDSAWTATKQSTLEAYNALIKDYVGDNQANVRMCDLYSTMQGSGNRISTEMNLDNLHPSQAGADFIAASVADVLLDWGLRL